MALVFDLTTGEFCEDAIQKTRPETAQTADPALTQEPALDLALKVVESTAEQAVEIMPAELAGTDPSEFVQRMEGGKS